MCVDQHYNMQFRVRQLVFLCNILVPHTNFNKPKPTFQAVKGKTRLTLLEKLYWKQRKYIILHTEEHRVRCYLNALWRWGPSDKKFNQHPFANTWGWQWKGQWKYESPYIEIKLDDYSLQTWKMFGIPQICKTVPALHIPILGPTHKIFRTRGRQFIQFREQHRCFGSSFPRYFNHRWDNSGKSEVFLAVMLTLFVLKFIFHCTKQDFPKVNQAYGSFRYYYNEIYNTNYRWQQARYVRESWVTDKKFNINLS